MKYLLFLILSVLAGIATFFLFPSLSLALIFAISGGVCFIPSLFAYCCLKRDEKETIRAVSLDSLEITEQNQETTALIPPSPLDAEEEIRRNAAAQVEELFTQTSYERAQRRLGQGNNAPAESKSGLLQRVETFKTALESATRAMIPQLQKDLDAIEADLKELKKTNFSFSTLSHTITHQLAPLQIAFETHKRNEYQLFSNEVIAIRNNISASIKGAAGATYEKMWKLFRKHESDQVEKGMLSIYEGRIKDITCADETQSALLRTLQATLIRHNELIKREENKFLLQEQMQLHINKLAAAQEKERQDAEGKPNDSAHKNAQMVLDLVELISPVTPSSQLGSSSFS